MPDPILKIKPEDQRKPSNKEIDFVGEAYSDFFKFRNYRSGAIRQLQFRSFDEYLRISRELFWNANTVQSEDLSNLGLEFAIPFARKEVMDFVSRLVALGVKPRLAGDALDGYGLKVLNGLYQRWRFKSNDKVEKFWQVLYGVVNGTTCSYIGYNNQKKQQRFLDQFDPTTGAYSISTKDKAYWNDVESTIVPLEDIYLKKVYERNVQKQGRIIWKSQMDPADFNREFVMYPDHKFVQVGSRIAEDSLYYRLLGGSGVTSTNKIEVLKVFDTDNDQYGIIANGMLLNHLGKEDNFAVSPLPFSHKMMPFGWSISEAIDEKFAYGLSLPFKIKDPHKMLNTQYVMLLERELRSIDKPVLSSDLESPAIIYGQKRVIPVTDVNAYKEMELTPASNDYFSTMNSVQNLMSGLSQGGMNQIIPSIQPKSAAEVDQVNQAKQMAMGSALTMYYDLIRQEMLLVLKTMLQFYATEKYGKEERIIRNLVVPDQSLTGGGTGNLEIRVVNKLEDPLKLFFESIEKSIKNGKPTEIIEATSDLIQNLEFEISGIDLEPEQTSEMKKAVFTSQFLIPLIQNWGQTGLIDPSKTLLRFLEKSGEAPQDFISDQALPQMLSMWRNGPSTFPPPQPGQGGQGVNRATPAGALAQSPVGAAFGGMSQGGQGMPAGAMPPSALAKIAQ